MKAEARVERVTTRLREVLGSDVAVEAVEPLTGGACQDNFRVVARVADETRTWCLRSDARTALPASVRRKVEFAVIQAAVAAGVPTAAARWLSPDLVREGGDAYFLDWIEGQAIGARVTRHRSLESAREVLPEQLADALIPQVEGGAGLVQVVGRRRTAPEAPRRLGLLPRAPHPPL